MTNQTQTVRALMLSARQQLQNAGAPEPEIESRLLVAHALGMSQARLLASMPDRAPGGASEALRPLLARRLTREPLAYVLGHREFYGRSFKVDRRVLVPRPETELLVERALVFASEVERTPHPTGLGLRVADIGTGSGALAVTLALELPEAQIVASDVSEDALQVARTNAAALRAGDRVTFCQGDLSSPLSGRFDIAVANLPYLPTAALAGAEPELSFEPRLALDGGADGLDVVARLLRSLPGLMREDRAVALVEVDPRNAARASRIAQEALPHSAVEVLPDLAGLDRCVEIRRNSLRPRG